MAQRSRPWEAGLGDGIGAGAGGCYTADEWDDTWWSLFSGRFNDYGVIKGPYNELEVQPTAIPSSQVNIETGAAIVNGKYYENDAVVLFPAGGFPVVTGAGRERYDRVVLEADWVTRTVRIARIAGAEAATGAGTVPAMTQNEGVLFQIPLATIYVDEPGVVAVIAADVTDDRHFIEARTHTFDAYVGARPGDYALLSDALADGHKSVFIREGTYTEAADVTLTSGMWICGESPEDAVIDLGVNQIIVNEAAADFADHVTIENIKMRSSHANGSIYLDRARNCIVRNVYVITGEGIQTSGNSEECTITLCHIVNATGEGIRCNGDRHIVQKNTIESAGGEGILCGADDTIIAENHVLSPTNEGIEVTGSGCRITENTVSSATLRGIYTHTGSDNAIVDNKVDDVATGILCDSAESTITANTVTNCSTAHIHVTAPNVVIADNAVADGTGIGIHGADVSITITGNTVYSVSGNGIEVDGATGRESVVSGNSCRDCGGDGIHINAPWVAIVGNFCSLNTGDGIQLAGGGGETCVGNVCYDNGGNGINITGGGLAVCNSNNCNINGGDGINIVGGANTIVVDGNNCQNNTGWGIDYANDRCIVTSNIALGNGAGQIDATGATNQVQANNIVV